MSHSAGPLPDLPRIAFSARRWMTFAAHGFKAVAQQHHGELTAHFRALFPPDGVIFDVGAHAGQFAKLFARLAPDGWVYSFEPGRYARTLLLLSLALNRVANVRAFPIGFGDKAGRMDLMMPIKESGSFAFGLAHLGTGSGPRREVAESIDLTTLDAFCAMLPLERLDFIKADVEGWELRMLEGGRHTLERFRPALWIEMVDASLARAGDSVAAAWAFLAERRYVPFAMAEGGTFTPLASPTEGDIAWVPEERSATMPRG